jgi:hypothetical protein
MRAQAHPCAAQSGSEHVRSDRQECRNRRRAGQPLAQGRPRGEGRPHRRHRPRSRPGARDRGCGRPGAGARRDRRPHPLRRAADVGFHRLAVAGARRDDGGDRQLRLRHRAGDAGHARHAAQEPLRGRGDVARRAARGRRLAVRQFFQLPRFHRPARRDAQRRVLLFAFGAAYRRDGRCGLGARGERGRAGEDDVTVRRGAFGGRDRPRLLDLREPQRLWRHPGAVAPGQRRRVPRAGAGDGAARARRHHGDLWPAFDDPLHGGTGRAVGPAGDLLPAARLSHEARACPGNLPRLRRSAHPRPRGLCPGLVPAAQHELRPAQRLHAADDRAVAQGRRQGAPSHAVRRSPPSAQPSRRRWRRRSRAAASSTAPGT